MATAEAQQQSTTAKSTKKKATNDLAQLKQVEQFNEAKAVHTLHRLIDEDNKNDFFIGGLVNHIFENAWVGEYETVDERIEQEFGLKRRKAYNLAAIYRALVEVGVTWEQVKGIGWTKLRVIAPILTKKNYKGWLKASKDNTQRALEDKVQKYNEKKKSTGEDTGPDETEEAPSTLTFKLYPESKKFVQKAVNKAMKEAETKDPGVALEHICSGYMASGNKKSEVAQYLKKIGLNETCKMLEKIFPGELDFTEE